MDAHNKNEFASMDSMKYWNKVNWYNGGMEHTARHLLYARFWVQFLYNIGLVPNKEMIDVRVSHGMVLGTDNQKMSKSKGNVINPDDIVKEYGADTLRIYEMFMGDYEMDVPWSTDSLKGCKRFVEKVIKLKDRLNDSDELTKDLSFVQNKTIKKVTDDLQTMRYNTAVSQLMILTNAYYEKDSISKSDYKLLLTLLNPIAPHITEELNEIIGYEPIVTYNWPEYDETKLESSELEIGVQVNGKLRGSIKVDNNTTEDEMVKLALENSNVKRFTEGKDILKTIVIKKRIVNIVVKM